MQYIEYARLVILALTLLVQLVEDIKGNKADPANAVDSGASLLKKIGEVAKVKELNSDTLDALVPDVKELVSKIHALRDSK